MDAYLLLKLGHVLGFILLGGGLLAVFISELQAYRTDELPIFAEAARYTALLYDALAVPGALLVGLTGFFLVRQLDLGFFAEPWVVGMWGLFLFEFIEGNTLTRVQFHRALRRSRQAVANGETLGDELRNEARGLVNRITHFLDLPLFATIVYCGTLRPQSWAHVLLTVVAGITCAAILGYAVPRLARTGRAQ
jgi:uncharacterized membrane protein